MGRKRFFWIVPVFIILVSLVVWGIRSYYSSEDYLKALPESPRALLSLDALKWADEADIDVKEVMSMLPEDFVSDNMGIDWSRKMYAFITSSENFGLLAPVSDSDNVMECFERMQKKGMCSDVHEKRGYTWAVIDGSWLAGLDDDKLMLLGPVFPGNIETARQEILSCFEQTEEESGMNSQLYGAINSKDGAIMCASHMDVIPSLYLDVLKMGLPEHVSINEIELLANIKLTPSEFCIDVEITSSNEDIRKAYDDWAAKRTKIKGDGIGYVPENTLFWGCAGINGIRMLDHLRDFPEIRTMLLALNMGIDADLMIKAIDGDVSLMVPEWTEGGKPEFIINARLDNTDFLKEVDYWKKSLAENPVFEFKDFGNARFYIAKGEKEGYFGVKDNNLYLTMDSGLVDRFEKDGYVTINAWKDEIKSCLYFGWLNCDALMKTPYIKSIEKNYSDMGLHDKLSAFSEVIIQSERPQQMKVRLMSKNNGNLLKVFLQ